jgi:hypothetical protein
VHAVSPSVRLTPSPIWPIYSITSTFQPCKHSHPPCFPNIISFSSPFSFCKQERAPTLTKTKSSGYCCDSSGVGPEKVSKTAKKEKKQHKYIFLVTMPRRYAFGRADDATHPDSMRATLSEFIATFIFVFAGEGSLLALGNLQLF